MRQHWPLLCLVLAIAMNLAALVTCESFYSIIAPGVIISNRKYPVAITLHEADEPATIRININGPSYQATQDVYVRPYETKKLEFEVFKLPGYSYNLTAEGISGITFRNQSNLLVHNRAGPKIYIQTDKAVYKPGDLVQFRVVMLNEHTKPLKIREPIRVEILDGQKNRIKQFKDITLVKGVYTDKFRISQYPVMGQWEIKVSMSGKYEYTSSKKISIMKYVLPKFSVHIKGKSYFIPEDGVIKVQVYGKYTFDKYVEGNITAHLVDTDQGNVLHEKRMPVTNIGDLQFRFDNPKDFDNIWNLRLEVELEEKYTGIIHKGALLIDVYRQRYKITTDFEEIRYRDNIPYRIMVKVSDWNDTPILDDHTTPIIMKHGSKEYSAYLDGKGEATFEFDYESDANHVFQFKDSMYEHPNIYVDKNVASGNETTFYCRLELKGDTPRLGSNLVIEVSSSSDISYLIYVIVGHSDIVRLEYVKVPPNQKTYTLQITPTIEMIPRSIIYVHYIQDGNLRYGELTLKFPSEFENQISVGAPKEARPGEDVTIELRAQRKAYGGYTYLPFAAKVYPGLLSGVLTFTNANYPVEYMDKFHYPTPPKSRYPWKFREKFPETWIFQNLEITDANTQLTLSIPDTITTWRITAFSVHDVTGFGLVKGPTDIITIKPFIININLPYAVKRGEILSIPITVFNYHDQDVDAEIIMYNEEQEFYFVDSNMEQGDRGSEDQQRVQQVNVPANSVASVVYWINPKQVGKIALRVTAENPLSSDAVLQKLLVEPEGVAQLKNNALYISVPQGETFRATLTADIPLNLVPDSEYLVISVGGDALVPTLENLNNLVQLPTGGGEQNMVNFAPNILVIEYLQACKRYSREKKLVEKAKNFIEIGYQQQLSYRHANGGYSVFGERMDEEASTSNDNWIYAGTKSVIRPDLRIITTAPPKLLHQQQQQEASTWLTAYTIRFFIKAEKYLPIEANIIESGLKFLVDQQLETGEFPFTGYLFQPAQQSQFGMSAFVLMTFLENENYASKYQDAIKKCLDFLRNNLDRAKDIYAKSIMANALQMANDPNAQKILEQLRGQQIQMDGLRWWSENNKHREKDIEITAYILTAQLAEDSTLSDASDDLLILKWLIAQRNSHGGFRSSHDTVVGLQALVKCSEKYNDLKNVNMQIQYAAKNNQSAILERNELNVDDNNVLILQTEVLPQTTRSLDIEVRGTGFSLVQLSYRYHLLDTNNFKHFQIEPQPKMLNPDEMSLEICFAYQQSPDDGPEEGTETNMIIMEVNLPSGFTTSDAYSNVLLEYDIVQRIELKNSDTTLVIYCEKLSVGIRHCLNILADKSHDVMMRKPAAIIAYDYYNISRYDTTFYNV